MAKTYRPYVPERDFLLPPSLREWLPEDHGAYFLSDMVDQLDLSAITTVCEEEGRGYPPYHPVMLTKVVTQLLAQAETADAAEDAEYGADRRGDELPAELQRRESRLQRIREAKRALEARAKGEAGGPTVRAGLQRAGVVDELQLIVGPAVTQETNDKKQLMPMITTIAQQSGDTPTQLLADAGYCSDDNLAAIADTTIDAYISTRKQKHGERPGPCPRGPLPQTATRIDRMSRKLHTKAGATVYAARKAIVEPVIGQIKQARSFSAIPVAWIREGAR